jgi:methylmalonyl-CoA/ethylmalonyl-CoA epimerase
MCSSNGESSLLPDGTAGYVDHVGIAVRDLEAGIHFYRDLLGLELAKVEDVPQEHVRVAFLKLDRGGGRGYVELLAATGKEGAIARFIAKRGPGLHHLAIAVTDIEHVARRCRAAGWQLIDDKPRRGAEGKRVVFVHPRSADGVLIELCEETPGCA